MTLEIAVSSWSFHDELYQGKLRLYDVSYRVHDLGYGAVELQDLFLYPRSPNPVARLFGKKAPPFVQYQYDRRTLAKVRLNRLRSGTRQVCWAIDADLTVNAGPDRQRQKAYLAGAIEAANYLNAPVIRLTLGGEKNDRAAYDRAVDLMSSVLPVAIARNVKFAVENHGGLSADPAMLAEFVQHFHSPFLGVCLDFGNFEDDRAIGMQTLAPHAIHVHAKSLAFDAQGEETQIDYRMCLDALKTANYAGAISIEFEGDGDPAVGIMRTRALIEKYA
ncbi:MAG TPA: sugar phosphate isomerase/epimerase family protein [Anaerolineae bacterium]|nr:sugar phosphate isomerase/epimerase family protein [Anaerolineae bacterium]